MSAVNDGKIERNWKLTSLELKTSCKPLLRREDVGSVVKKYTKVWVLLLPKANFYVSSEGPFSGSL